MADSPDSRRLSQRIEEQKKELSEVQEEMEAIRDSLSVLSKKEQEINRTLKKIDGEINRERSRLGKLKKRIEEVKDKLTQARRKVKTKQEDRTEYSLRLEKIVRAYYYKRIRKSGQSLVSSLLGEESKSFPVLKLMEKSVEDYLNASENIDRITEEAEELRLKNKELESLKQEVIDIQESFINKKNNQLSLLKDIRERQNQRQKELKEMEEEKKRLRELIESLAGRAQSLRDLREISGDFAEAKGRLPWPAEGEISANFGKQKHPSLDAYIYKRGIELKTKVSAAVKNVAGGEVVYADSFRGRGEMVVINHGNNYYTIYGGLKEVFVDEGRMMEPLEHLGSSSGDLYFELGKGSEPEDPLKWLE